METLLKCTQPALVVASDHLIELVDRVMERHPHKGKFRSRRKLFSWLVAIWCVPAWTGPRRSSKSTGSGKILV